MTPFSKGLTSSVSLFLALSSVGCATYQNKVGEARLALAHGDNEKALTQLKPLAEEENGDQLVYLLDYATALQASGKYQESNKSFLLADRLADQADYHSISRVAGSLALNEEMVQYKGDTFEKIFINAYLAMNFLEMGQLDDALVEARRINEKYLKYRADEKQKFELNSFSKYLSALIWEASRSYDDAYIAYAEAYKIDPSISTIGADLIRSSKNARRMDTYKEWKTKFPNVSEDPAWYDKKNGELIVLVQQGWGPRKEIGRNGYRFPDLVPTYSFPPRASLSIEGNPTGQVSYTSQEIYDVDQAAIATLKDDQGILIAKRVAGVATKAVLADQLRQKNQALGQLAWIAMNLSDRADLRQWSTLPKTIQLIRVPLKEGHYKFKLQGADYNGVPAGEKSLEKEVEIKAGKKAFTVWRMF